MLTKEQAGDYFSRIRKLSSADDVELTVAGGRSALTRFANNTILQNVAEENHELSVRVQFGGRTARATTNKFDDESLSQVVKSAEELALVQSEDPDLLPMYAGGEDISRAQVRHSAATAALTAADRADAVSRMVAVAKRLKLNSAGVYANAEHVHGVFNSRGVARWHGETAAEASVTMQGGDSSGWQKASAPDARDVHAVSLAEVAAQKCVDSQHPKEIAADKYTVILEPSAVLDLVGFMFWDFSALSLVDQRSFLNNRIGKKLFSDAITVVDDVRHPLQSGAPFDGEGVPRQEVLLINKGVPEKVVFARGTAEQVKKSELASQLPRAKATGHGFPLPNEMGEAPTNVVFKLNDGVAPRSIDQMIAGTERGVLVTRVWYIREVDPYEKIVTGMTRDGTFWVEGGVVRHGLRNFRFNQSLIQLLSNVESFTEPVRAAGEESFEMVVPGMTVRDFNFTEVTKF
jgi:predicted Zn-dependent protease